jgi:hypothetical protein
MLAALHPSKGASPASFVDLCTLIGNSREGQPTNGSGKPAGVVCFKRAMVGGCVVEAGVADWPPCLRWSVWVRGWGTGMY